MCSACQKHSPSVIGVIVKETVGFALLNVRVNDVTYRMYFVYCSVKNSPRCPCSLPPPPLNIVVLTTIFVVSPGTGQHQRCYRVPGSFVFMWCTISFNFSYLSTFWNAPRPKEPANLARSIPFCPFLLWCVPERIRDSLGGGTRGMLEPTEGGQRCVRLGQREGRNRAEQRHHGRHCTGGFIFTPHAGTGVVNVLMLSTLGFFLPIAHPRYLYVQLGVSKTCMFCLFFFC